MLEVVLSEDKLQEKCFEWQKILRLQDWKVNVAISRERDFSNKDSDAEIGVNVQHKTAKIKIIDPVDRAPESPNPQDMEKALVHELLHIHLWQLTEDNKGLLVDIEEQALNMITEALIQLYRRGGEQGHEKHNGFRRDVATSRTAI